VTEPARDKTTLRFLGTGSCIPPVEDETACFLLNEDTLVDTGWCTALAMRRFGCDPLKIRTVFVTHCHHDHYLGLAALVFYFAMKRKERGPDPAPLTIVGPRTEIPLVVRRAQEYLQWGRYPEIAVRHEVVGLAPGSGYRTDRFRVATAQTVHPTIGLCYRFEDTRTGATLAITGDTAYHPPLARHAAGVDVLVHEASCGPVAVDPLGQAGHSGAVDAARIAQQACPGRLYLVHCSHQGDERAKTLQAAREVFPDTHMPEPGEVIELPLE
jgi:ribonuclease Z